PGGVGGPAAALAPAAALVPTGALAPAAARAPTGACCAPQSLNTTASLSAPRRKASMGPAPDFASAQIAIHTDFSSVYKSSTALPCSRPNPDCLNPPNGMLGSTKLWQFTQTVPPRILATRR